MNKEKKQQVILIVLIPVFLVGLIYMRMQKGPGQASVRGMASEEIIIPDASIDAMPGPKTDFTSEYSPSGQDPFKDLLQLYLYQMREAMPKEKATLPLPALTIEGIIWNTHMPQAIVNGDVVRIGDTIAGVTITNIEKQGITIDYSGEPVLIKR
jgi:hypothetical protein